MKKVLIFTILLIFLHSCEKALEIELPEAEPKLVINSHLRAGSYSSLKHENTVTVSNSIGGLASLEEYVYTDSIPVIDYAQVSINEMNNANNTIMHQYNLEFESDCYCYINRDFKPKENTNYELNVSVVGFPTISAQEEVPSKPEYTISNFELRSSIDDNSESHLLNYDLCAFSITIQDDPYEKNYYKLRVVAARGNDNENGNNNQTTRCIYKIQDPIFLIPINRHKPSDNYYTGKHGYFTDELFNGQEKTFFVEVDKPEGAWSHFFIEIAEYSENKYLFNLTKKEQHRDVSNMLFNSEPIFIKSNIDGGHGIFGAKGVSQKIYLPTFYPTNGWIEN